eukprot:5369072-Pleurochrysis_carterae.AAC.1
MMHDPTGLRCTIGMNMEFYRLKGHSWLVNHKGYTIIGQEVHHYRIRPYISTSRVYLALDVAERFIPVNSNPVKVKHDESQMNGYEYGFCVCTPRMITRFKGLQRMDDARWCNRSTVVLATGIPYISLDTSGPTICPKHFAKAPIMGLGYKALVVVVTRDQLLLYIKKPAYCGAPLRMWGTLMPISCGKLRTRTKLSNTKQTHLSSSHTTDVKRGRKLCLACDSV